MIYVNIIFLIGLIGYVLFLYQFVNAYINSLKGKEK